MDRPCAPLQAPADVGLVIAIATLVTMGFATKSLTAGPVEGLLAMLGLGFGPAAPLAMVALQNTVAAHHLGSAVGTLAFMRNLYATMLVSLFGAIVLAGTDLTSAPGPAAAAIPVEGFSRVFRCRAQYGDIPRRTAAHGGKAAAHQPGCRDRHSGVMYGVASSQCIAMVPLASRQNGRFA